MRFSGLFSAQAIRRWLASAVAVGALGIGFASVASATPFSFDSIGQTYTQNFNGYRGSSATLPDHMSVSWDTSRNLSGNTFEQNTPYTGVNAGAFTAYTSNESDYSFGIRERSPVDLRDGRLFFEFTNNTGVAITEFDVSYDVEAWFVGDRRNRIRLKYDDQLGSTRFENDIFSTDNPSATTQANTAVDGSLAVNRTTVAGFVDLNTYLDPSGNPFGPLGPGETAYFRWQFSNTDIDAGTTRSGLAINNVAITAVPEPTALVLAALGMGLAGLAARRRLWA